MNMIKNLISKIFIIIFCLIFTNNLFAATNVKGPATEYIITMTKIELCETGSTISNCLNPINITTGNGATADIASVEAGVTAATVADFGKATLGKTYTYIQTTMSRAMTITGTVGDCKTKAGINGSLDGLAGGAAVGHEGTAGSALQNIKKFEILRGRHPQKVGAV